MAAHLLGAATALLLGGRAPTGIAPSSTGSARRAAPSMEILRAQAGRQRDRVLQFLEYSTAKENMGETVFVLSYTDDFSMSNAVFEQVAETFEASALQRPAAPRGADRARQRRRRAGRGRRRARRRAEPGADLEARLADQGGRHLRPRDGAARRGPPLRQVPDEHGQRRRRDARTQEDGRRRLGERRRRHRLLRGQGGAEQARRPPVPQPQVEGATDASGNYINADGTPRRTSDYFPGGNGRPGQGTACRATSLAPARRAGRTTRGMGSRRRGTIGRRAWVESCCGRKIYGTHTHATRHDSHGTIVAADQAETEVGKSTCSTGRSAHFLRRHSCAASSLWPPSWYDESTYWTSVASQRRWTLSQPTCSMS